MNKNMVKNGEAIVYQLVTILEGKIELISVVNKGSTLIVIIPIDRPSCSSSN